MKDFERTSQKKKKCSDLLNGPVLHKTSAGNKLHFLHLIQIKISMHAYINILQIKIIANIFSDHRIVVTMLQLHPQMHA